MKNAVNHVKVRTVEASPVVLAEAWAGTIDPVKRLRAVTSLDGWYGYSAEVETVPALFGTRNYHVDTTYPDRVLSVAFDITGDEGVDLEDVHDAIMEAIGNKTPVAITRTRTKGATVKVETLTGVVESLDSWDMRSDHDGAYGFTIRALDPFKTVKINGVAQPPRL